MNIPVLHIKHSLDQETKLWWFASLVGALTASLYSPSQFWFLSFSEWIFK